ncbi:MAG: hypothetical protein ACP5RF_02490 [Candidatus Micrarchaeia archaeon]
MILLLLLILVLDFAISIWNAYASGYNIGLLRKSEHSGFTAAAAYSGLGLAFTGMAYVLIIVLSALAYYIGYIPITVLEFAVSLDFLVFGLLIIGFGLMVTIQSIIIAAKKKSIGSILIALWNTFAEVFDIISYASGFSESVQMLKRNSKGSGNAIFIVIVALLIAFFITHAAYRHGLKKARVAIG